MKEKNVPFLLPKDILNKKQKQEEYLEKVRKCFQTIMKTEAGKEVVKYLICQSRVFANFLKVYSAMKSYGVSYEYILGQSDFGKDLLKFLTPQQVAELIAETQKEEKNVG